MSDSSSTYSYSSSSDSSVIPEPLNLGQLPDEDDLEGEFDDDDSLSDDGGKKQPYFKETVLEIPKRIKGLNSTVARPIMSADELIDEDGKPIPRPLFIPLKVEPKKREEQTMSELPTAAVRREARADDDRETPEDGDEEAKDEDGQEDEEKDSVKADAEAAASAAAAEEEDDDDDDGGADEEAQAAEAKIEAEAAARARKKGDYEDEDEDGSLSDEELLVDSSQYETDLKSTPLSWRKMPLKLRHGEVIFELEEFELALPDQWLRGHARVFNASKGTHSYRFATRPNSYYSVKFTPSAGTLGPSQEQRVRVSVRPRCSCAYVESLDLLVTWPGGLADYETAKKSHAPLNFVFESGLESRLQCRGVVLSREHSALARTDEGGVYRALYFGTEVAVKVNQCTGHEALVHWRRERDMLKQLRCPFVTAFVGSIVTPTVRAVVTEYCPHGTLARVLALGELPLSLRMRFVADVARALSYLHGAGLVHQTLSSKHVLVCSLDSGAGTACRLSGLGDIVPEDTLYVLPDLTHAAADMPLYTAPELLVVGTEEEGAPCPFTTACGVYSFGVLWAEIVLQHCPFEARVVEEAATPFAFACAVTNGARPVVPPDALPERYAGPMRECWAPTPADRPDINAMLNLLLT